MAGVFTQSGREGAMEALRFCCNCAAAFFHVLGTIILSILLNFI